MPLFQEVAEDTRQALLQRGSLPPPQRQENLWALKKRHRNTEAKLEQAMANQAEVMSP